MDDITVGDDGRRRCRWAGSTPEYVAYHDDEWGRPVGGETAVFEKLCLEGFQSGLSWITILRKRDAFRRAFAGFDPAVVSEFGPGDVERLIADASIIRHRGKIEATINNAHAMVRLHEEGRSLAEILWSYEVQSRRAPRSMGDLAATTQESERLSAELRKLGFRFVGPTTAYATMQALGVVNDHLADCDFRSATKQSRAEFRRPTRPL